MQLRHRYLLLFTTVLATVFILFKVYENRRAADDNYDFQQFRNLRTQYPWIWQKAFQNWRISLEKRSLPVIYVVTPTYGRPTQKAELTRLSHTLMLVPKLHWIIVEDSNEKSQMIEELLIRSGIRFTHLNQPTPYEYTRGTFDAQWRKPRGVFQRNAAIQWLRSQNFQGTLERVVYFADDDNTYDLQLFEEMRYTVRMSAWPVGLVGGVKWESPIVEDGKISGWMVGWGSERPFAIDMAGFAINLRLLWNNPNAKFSPDVPIGYVESSLLQMIASLQDIEPKAENCTKIYVWHTRTEKTKFLSDKKLKDFHLKYPNALELEN